MNAYIFLFILTFTLLLFFFVYFCRMAKRNEKVCLKTTCVYKHVLQAEGQINVHLCSSAVFCISTHNTVFKKFSIFQFISLSDILD